MAHGIKFKQFFNLLILIGDKKRLRDSYLTAFFMSFFYLIMSMIVLKMNITDIYSPTNVRYLLNITASSALVAASHAARRPLRGSKIPSATHQKTASFAESLTSFFLSYLFTFRPRNSLHRIAVANLLTFQLLSDICSALQPVRLWWQLPMHLCVRYEVQKRLLLHTRTLHLLQNR